MTGSSGHSAGLAACFPEFAEYEWSQIETGWDSKAFLISEQWIARIPRRAEVTDAARVELRLLPLLATALPIQVPDPTAVCEAHAAMLYPLIPGEPLSADMVGRIGRTRLVDHASAFLNALHGISPDDARLLGVLDESGDRWVASYERVVADFAERVVPLLPSSIRAGAAAWLSGVPGGLAKRGEDVLIHKDLGPAHLIAGDDGLVGVIDWTDARIGDRAIDYVAFLHYFGPAFAHELAAATGIGEQERVRAHVYFQLGPWWEVVHGLNTDDERFVRSGIEGLLSRLPELAG